MEFLRVSIGSIVVYLGIICGKKKHHTNNVYLYNLNNSNFVLTSKLSTIKKLLKINIKLILKRPEVTKNKTKKEFPSKDHLFRERGESCPQAPVGLPWKFKFVLHNLRFFYKDRYLHNPHESSKNLCYCLYQEQQNVADTLDYLSKNKPYLMFYWLWFPLFIFTSIKQLYTII